MRAAARCRKPSPPPRLPAPVEVARPLLQHSARANPRSPQPNSPQRREFSGATLCPRSDVRFTLTHNGRAQSHLHPAAPRSAYTQSGRPFREEAIPVQAEAGSFRLRGLVAQPTYSRGARDAQYSSSTAVTFGTVCWRTRCARPIATCSSTSAHPATCCLSSGPAW